MSEWNKVALEEMKSMQNSDSNVVDFPKGKRF